MLQNVMLAQRNRVTVNALFLEASEIIYLYKVVCSYRFAERGRNVMPYFWTQRKLMLLKAKQGTFVALSREADTFIQYKRVIH